MLTGRMNSSWYVKTYLWQVFSTVSERRETRGLIFHDDNAKAHWACITNEFLLENHVEQYQNAAYSPGWSPCEFFLFPKLKKQLRGIRLNDDNETVTAFEEAVDSLTREDFRRLVYSNTLMLKDSTLKKYIKIILWILILKAYEKTFVVLHVINLFWT